MHDFGNLRKYPSYITMCKLNLDSKPTGVKGKNLIFLVPFVILLRARSSLASEMMLFFLIIRNTIFTQYTILNLNN